MHRDFPLPDTPQGRRLYVLDLIFTRVLYVVTAVILIINMLIIIARQDRNRDTFNLLVNCTTPHHSCYNREQTPTIKKLQQLIIAANYCAAHSPNATYQQVTACAVRLVKP